jgi:hypothetical protein
MAYYNTRQSKEPQTAEALTAKLEDCKALQETMKAVNTYWRKAGTCVGAPGITEEQAKKLDNKIATTTRSWEKQPYSTYDLTNNNATIKRLESKVKEVSRGFEGWKFEGGHAEANNVRDRLQLFFDERPDKEKCVVLKRNGFHWSPTEVAWQRQLTDNAIRAANWIDFLKPTDGRTVREHQPPMSKEDKGAR